MKSKIFAILQHQEKLVKTYCFGSCGKIIFGALADDLLGACFPCREEDCPHEEGRLKYGTSGDDVVWVRKLKEGREGDAVDLNDGRTDSANNSGAR